MKKIVEIFSFGNDYYVKLYSKDCKADAKEKCYHTADTCDERIKMLEDLIHHLEGKSLYKVITSCEAAKLAIEQEDKINEDLYIRTNDRYTRT